MRSHLLTRASALSSVNSKLSTPDTRKHKAALSVIELKTLSANEHGREEVYCASTHSSVGRSERSRRILSIKACISPMRPPISIEKYTIARWIATSRAENILE